METATDAAVMNSTSSAQGGSATLSKPTHDASAFTIRLSEATVEAMLDAALSIGLREYPSTEEFFRSLDE